MKSGRDHSPGMRNVRIRFPFVAQKDRLSKLFILSLWNATKEEMTIFIEHANISIIRQQNSRLKCLRAPDCKYQKSYDRREISYFILFRLNVPFGELF